MSLEDTDAVFQSTRWTLVAALHTDDATARESALQSLVHLYWPPVYAFLRCQGRAREEAAELTQAYFANVVLDRKLFDRADPHRGRLRSFLISGLKRFLTDQHRHGTTRSALNALQLGEIVNEDQTLVDGGIDPSETFDRRWALLMLERALEESRQHFIDSGRQAFWSAFERRVLQPSTSGAAPDPLSLVASDFGFDSPGHAAAAVQSVKKRVTALLRQAIAETLASPADQEDEFSYLLEVLASRSVGREVAAD